MSKIKSALELALEKTKDIVVDKAELAKKRLEKTGRETFVALQNGESQDRADILENRVKDLSQEDKSAVRRGVLEGALSQISLSRASYPEPVDQGTIEILNLLFAMDTSAIFQQLEEMFSAYKSEIENLKTQLSSQMASRLGPKLQALAEQTGQSPEKLVEQDPEYQRAFTHHLGQMKEHYQNSLTQLKDYLRQQFPG